MPSSGISLANDLFYRLDQRVTPTQCVPFLNHGLAKIDSVASWIWDQVSLIGTVPIGNVVSLPTLNMGKKISCFNQNLLPISRTEQSDMATSAAGYLNVGSTIYSTFRLGTNVTVPFLEFFPGLLVNPPVNIYYHQNAPFLTINNPLTTVRWTSPEMDDVLLDIAELDARRLYKAPTEPGLGKDIEDRLQMLAAAFSTERINTGPPAEVAGSKAENDGAGRN